MRGEHGLPLGGPFFLPEDKYAQLPKRLSFVQNFPKMGDSCMRIIARRALREFWEGSPAYADAVTPLTEWYRHMEKAVYATPQALKGELRTASILKGGRAVFNIAGNKYRVITTID